MRLFVPLFVFLTLFSLSASAQEPAVCVIPPDQQPGMRVNVESAPPEIDHSKSRAALKSFEIASVSPYGNGTNVHVNGLMRGSVSFETKTSLGWQRSQQTDENCFWYSRVEITLKLKPVIYVAQEIVKDTCLYREVMTHEYKHIATDENLVRDYQLIFQDELDRFLKNSRAIGPYPLEKKTQVQMELTKSLDYTVQALYDRMKNERIRRQASIDTREEYDRVQKLCPGEVGSM